MTFRAAAEFHTSAGSLTGTIPASVQAGDMLAIFAGMNDGGSASVDWGNLDGWNKLDGQRSGSNLYAAVYQRVAQSGDAGATFTLTSDTTGKSMAIVAAWSGRDPVSPVNDFTALPEVVSTASHLTPTVQTDVDGCDIIIAAVHSDSSTESWQTATGYTKRQDSLDNAVVNGHVVGTVQDKGPVNVGTYGGEALVAAAPAAKAITYTLALAPASSTQVARPVSDVAASGVVGVPTPGAGSGVYADVGGADDAHYAEFNDNGSLQVALAALVDPQSSAGHTIKFRAEFGAGAAGGTLTTTLKAATTTIASWTDTLTGGWQTFTHTLTGAQADAIATDKYDELTVTMTADLT